jgi:hypothetical protein
LIVRFFLTTSLVPFRKVSQGRVSAEGFTPVQCPCQTTQRPDYLRNNPVNWGDWSLGHLVV